MFSWRGAGRVQKMEGIVSPPPPQFIAQPLAVLTGIKTYTKPFAVLLCNTANKLLAGLTVSTKERNSEKSCHVVIQNINKNKTNN